MEYTPANYPNTPDQWGDLNKVLSGLSEAMKSTEKIIASKPEIKSLFSHPHKEANYPATVQNQWLIFISVDSEPFIIHDQSYHFPIMDQTVQWIIRARSKKKALEIRKDLERKLQSLRLKIRKG